MFKLVVLLVVFSGATLGAPPASADHPMLDGRIVGGVATTIEEHPYQISLQYANNHYCGGGIVSAVWIITAAHCVVGSPVSVFSVRAGSSIRNSGGQVIAAGRIFVHASYDSQTIDYDIALIQLVSPISVANAISIPLASPGTGPSAGSIATVTGWGALTEGGPSPNILQEVRVPVVSQADCRLAYGASSITDRMFCAGVLGVGGLDACQGDSGGPVIVNGFLTGLVSWGAGCARPSHPGVKTSIPPLRSWIDNVLASTYTYSDVIEL